MFDRHPDLNPDHEPVTETQAVGGIIDAFTYYGMVLTVRYLNLKAWCAHGLMIDHCM